MTPGNGVLKEEKGKSKKKKPQTNKKKSLLPFISVPDIFSF